MVGILGLNPTIAAIRAGKDIGLANKETLVAGGALITALVAKHGVKLIPIDSEHTAIFQCLDNEKHKSIERIILTASGGPFRLFNDEQLDSVTVEQALNHPSWKMGPKVTIDSSTLLNKGLEAIEAHWLYNLPAEKIDMIIHPQSIIHSMVEFVDRSIIAQMSENSMTIPIQFAMSYPERHAMQLPRYDFTKHPQLQFFPVDAVKFPCVRLAYEAIRQGGSLPCYMNSANEVLVDRFLAKEIRWKDIARTLEHLMSRHKIVEVDSFETILAIDAQAREEAKQLANQYV
jgi:1-deoxy-D-xylulose-5-phosphate reductoisomerase